jgi:hypothetical protein
MSAPGDPEYDQAFRNVFRMYLSSPPAICARCAQTLPVHAALAFIGDLDDGHLFEEMNQN